VAAGARLVIVSSTREREDVVAGGVDPSKVRIRGNAFPEPPPAADGDALAGIVPAGAPVALYVGRIAAEKGIEHLVEAARRLPELQVVLAGPDDRHGTMAVVEAAMADPRTAGRIHRLPATPGPPFDLYRRADLFVLASGGENFGLVAAEAASVGTPVIVSDRAGIAASFERDEALVIPYDEEATVAAIERVLGNAELRERLAEGARRAAQRSTWDAVVTAQLGLYDEALGNG
jgi:D-inositol-3-phosphate glycosyltransferase